MLSVVVVVVVVVVVDVVVVVVAFVVAVVVVVEGRRRTFVLCTQATQRRRATMASLPPKDGTQIPGSAVRFGKDWSSTLPLIATSDHMGHVGHIDIGETKSPFHRLYAVHCTHCLSRSLDPRSYSDLCI